MNKLLKDAIADAKAVRETALANAKLVLEEAFQPKLQSMLSSKIKEEMDDEEELDLEPTDDQMEVTRMQRNAGIVGEGDDEGMEDEAPVEDEESFEDEASEDVPEDEAPPVEDEAPVEDEESFEDEAPVEDEGEVSDEDLEELIRELEGEDEEEVELDQLGEMEDEEAPAEEAPAEEDEELDLNELINALKESDDNDEDDKPSADEKDEANEAVKADLNEAYSVIKYLRSKLSEVNLLNAKLLFVNKLFKKSDLTESQKVRIIETFDRAKNVREAKLIYSTLAESTRTSGTPKRTIKPKQRMNEGLASAPQKKTKVIVEVDPMVARFKELVNYNK